jgi:hypothetical protein
MSGTPKTYMTCGLVRDIRAKSGERDVDETMSGVVEEKGKRTSSFGSWIRLRSPDGATQ